MESYRESQKHLARPYRKAVLQTLLILTAISGLLFFTLNIQRENYPLAFAELGMACYSVFIFWAIGNTKHLERWILAFILPFCITMMFALTSPRATTTVFAWVLLIPILSHLLMGRGLGLLVSAVFMGTAAVIFFFKYHDAPEMMQPLPIANMGLMSLTILAFSHIYEITREQSESRLLKMAQTDALTGLANRARLSDVFEQERKRSLRNGTPLSMLVLDLDHFKQVNDQYGHDMGDRVLQAVSDLLKQSMREQDFIGRWGGEEFLAILPDTNFNHAGESAERIRKSVEELELYSDGIRVCVTLSIGITQYRADELLSDAIARADVALYESKSAGRNRVEVAEV